MKTLIKKKTTFSNTDNLILLSNSKNKLSKIKLSKKEIDYVKKEQQDKKEVITINQYERWVFIITPKDIKDCNQHSENCRMIGDVLAEKLKDESSVAIINVDRNQTEIMQITEGMMLSNYTFTKHKTEKAPNRLSTIYLCKKSNEEDISELQNIIDSVYLTRDLINEPFSHLTAKDLANAAIKSGEKTGIKTTVLDKKKIESLKMGGLLAVNKGSIDEPTFTIMEWKPKNKKNKNPIVLIGKGIVFDTGGLSLKPTANSMDLMKTDMGGAGTVIGAMQAIATNK